MASDMPWNDRLRATVRAVIDNPAGQAACEFVAGALLAAEMGAVFWWHNALSVPMQILLWAQIVATAGALRWAGLFPLFGPVLVFDLMRAARRKRYFFARILYASMLAVILFWSYFLLYQEYHGDLTSNRMGQFSSSIFYTFMLVQFGLATLLTPAYTAGAIAEEKDRKTLPFLMATDLRDREIVLGKLMSRLLNLTLFVLTGLPILSFLQFVGGVDPDLLLSGFAATFLTMVGLASLSLFCSVLAKKTRDAIVMTYVLVFAYIALSSLSWLVLLLPSGFTSFPSTSSWASPITITDLVGWFNAGNLVAALVQIFVELSRGTGRLDLLVPKLLRNYALFHFLLSLVCLAWATYRLRPQALKEAGEVPRVRRGVFRLMPRPRVGQWPMIWKEVFVERGFRLHWLVRIVVAVLIIASFLPVVGIIAHLANGRGVWGDPWQMFRESINVWERFVGTGVACLMLIAVAVRAAGSISGERDKQTFDELLTSPLGSDAILFGKWLGSLCSVRWAWVWLLSIWCTAGLTLSIHPFAILLQIVAWFVYATFLTNLGLWFSMTCRTTLRAIVWTLAGALGLAFGHWLIWILLIPLFIGRSTLSLEWLAKFQLGLTPPLAMAFSFAFELFEEDRRNHLGREWLEFVAYGLLGVAFWFLASLILAGMCSSRFRELTGRATRYRTRVVPRSRSSHPRLRDSEVRQNGRERMHPHTSAHLDEVIPVVDDETAEELPVEEPPAGAS